MADLPYKVLIGFDIINNTGARIHFDTKSFRCTRTPEIPILLKMLITQTKVSASCSQVIPASSQIVMNATVKNIPDGQTGFIRPNHWLGPRCNYVSARVLVTNHSAAVVVLLMNPTKTDITIYRNITVGYFQPLYELFESVANGTLGGDRKPTDEIHTMSSSTEQTTKPAHTASDVDSSDADLKQQEKLKLERLSLEYRSIFANDMSELEMANTEQHRIEFD